MGRKSVFIVTFFVAIIIAACVGMAKAAELPAPRSVADPHIQLP
jgi:hypothetical protein